MAFSGGKGLSGPQGTGLLLGRRELIAAARLHTLPHSDSIGRGLKVGKEDMIGLMVAVELYLERDHQADWAEWERRVQLLRDYLAAIPRVSTERFVPAIANQVPHVRVRWDGRIVRITPSDVARQLRQGDPSVELVPTPSAEGCIEVASWTLLDGDAEVVARRISEILAACSVT